MKTLLFVATFFLGQLTFGQELISSIDGTHFIQGIYLENKLTLNKPKAGVDEVRFFSFQNNKDSLLGTDSDSTDGFTWSLDMGQLAPNTSIYAQMYIGTEEESIPINNFTFTIIPTPEWLKEIGYATNIKIENNTLSFQGNYTVQRFQHTFSSNTRLIGNRSLGAVGIYVFNIEYDMNLGKSTVKDNKMLFFMNILDQLNLNYDLIPKTKCLIDDSLNVVVIFEAEYNTKKIDLNLMKIPFPLGGVASASISAGISFYGTLKGNLVIGSQNGKFGFININNNKTRITGVLNGSGFVRGEVSVFLGLASADASLNVKARIGVGFEYVNVPSVKYDTLFGGDLKFYGSVCARSFWGLGPKKCKEFPPFYNINFGDTNAYRSGKNINNFDKTFNSKSLTFKDNGTMVMPEFRPQPSFSTNNNKLYSVWLDVINNKNCLLFSKLNSELQSFTNSQIITEIENPISNPKIGILNDGSAIITWTQNRYTISSLPVEISSEEILQGQDIWVAFYDALSQSITFKEKIEDSESNILTSRAEGQATITVSKNNEAMITWTAADINEQTSDIWFCQVKQENNSWILSTPKKIIDLTGVNKDVSVVYSDSISALAVWINDPDGNENTNNSDIIYSEWNGNSWTNYPEKLTNNQGDLNFNNISIASNNSKIALAYTGSKYFKDGDFYNNLSLEIYDSKQMDWMSNSKFIDSDSIYYFQNPQISISENGIASLSYQVIEMFPDTVSLNNGELYLYVKDLNNATSKWTEITGNTNLCDTNTFIWDMTAGFGSDNQYYVMTQEYSDNGPITKNPKNGVLFGDTKLSMVLRGLKVNSNSNGDITITDIDEPETKTTRLTSLENPTFRYINNYPNPFQQFTTIEFSIYQPSYVTLEIFNATGTKVATLLDSNLGQGMYTTNFDAGNLPEGIYHSKLTVNGESSTGKLVLIK